MEGTKHLFIGIMSLPVLILWKIPLTPIMSRSMFVLAYVFSVCFVLEVGGWRTFPKRKRELELNYHLVQSPLFEEYSQLGALPYTFERHKHNIILSLKDNLLCKA
jgi:hypothetical protein